MSNRINSLEELNEMVARGGSRIVGNPLSNKQEKNFSTPSPRKAEASQKVEPAKKNKYRNIKTERFGVVFDSQKECARYAELRVLEHAGEIKDLERQVEYRMDIRDVHVCSFFADFRYYEKGKGAGVWILIVEDVKSPITRKNPTYRIKAKLLRGIYGIKVRET